jgi:hypothetical protein
MPPHDVEAVAHREAGRRYVRVEPGRHPPTGRFARLGAVGERRGDVPVEIGGPRPVAQGVS